MDQSERGLAEPLHAVQARRGCSEEDRASRATLAMPSRYRVALTNPRQHPPDSWVLDILRGCDARLEAHDCASREDVIALCADADAVLVASAPIDAQALLSFQRCRAVIRMGTGYDNIDVEAAGNAGIPVANVPEFCTDEVADHTMAMLLACVRRLVNGDCEVRAGVWNPSHLMPVGRLRGQVLGLVGFGKIGQAVARRAVAFGLRVIYFDPILEHAPVCSEPTAFQRLDHLLCLTDLVSLHVPHTERPRGRLALPQLRRVKRTSSAIRSARAA